MDPRHAEILIAALGTKIRPVVTPGVKETATAKRGSVRPAAEEDATEFSTRVSAKAEKAADLHKQIRDLAAQLDKQQNAAAPASLAACAHPSPAHAAALGQLPARAFAPSPVHPSPATHQIVGGGM